MNSKLREKKIERAIELIYDSLESHLPYTYGNIKEVKGTKKFHKKCIREYAEIIKILSELL